MTRCSTPTIHCDSSYACDNWEVDYYATDAHSVGEVRVTETRRAPGWTVIDHDDICPDCRGLIDADDAESATP